MTLSMYSRMLRLRQITFGELDSEHPKSVTSPVIFRVPAKHVLKCFEQLSKYLKNVSCGNSSKCISA